VDTDSHIITKDDDEREKKQGVFLSMVGMIKERNRKKSRLSKKNFYSIHSTAEFLSNGIK